MKRGLAVAAIAISTLSLAGCGLTLDELIEMRQKCDDAGGVFEQWNAVFGGEHARCDLSIR